MATVKSTRRPPAKGTAPRKALRHPKVSPAPAAVPAPVPKVKRIASPQPTAMPVKAESEPKPIKPTKPPKQRSKPVRDSFTMPPADFALIAALKARALAAGRDAKKSELLRAGLHALAALEVPALLAALGALTPVKVGRPKSSR